MSEIVPGSVGPGADRARVHGSGRTPPQVGFGTANPITAGLLARYLVGRVVAARVSAGLLIVALVVAGGAIAVWMWGPRWCAVLLGLFALAVVAFRALVVAILRRIMGVGRLGPVEGKVSGLVADTHGDLRRELRRIGLPATVFGMPLLLVRLLGRRRASTFSRLKAFDVNRVVPRSRQDELHFLVTSQLRQR